MSLIKSRVLKLLENKTNDFKRKYYMLSSLSTTENIDSYEIYTEACSYLENLINTDGEIPSSNAVINLYERSLKLNEVSDKSCKKNVNFIKNYCDLLFSNKTNLFENIVEKELVLAGGNYRKKEINEKLYSVMIESFNRKKSIFLESSDLESGKSLGNTDKEIADKLIKVENINFIRNVLKIFVPTEQYKSDEEMRSFLKPVIPAIVAKYDLIFNKNASSEDMKKIHIISLIDYCLNIAQEIYSNNAIDTISKNLGLNDYTYFAMLGGKNKNRRELTTLKKLSLTRGQLDDTVKTVLKGERNKLVNKIVLTKNSINTNALDIKDLYKLLNRCMKNSTYKLPPKRVGKYQTTQLKRVKDKEGKENLEVVPDIKDIIDTDSGMDTNAINIIKRDMNALYNDLDSQDNQRAYQDYLSSQEYQDYLSDTASYEKSLESEELQDKLGNEDFLTAKEAESAL